MVYSPPLPLPYYCAPGSRVNSTRICATSIPLPPHCYIYLFTPLLPNPGDVSSLLQLHVRLLDGHTGASSPTPPAHRRDLPKPFNLACMILFTPSSTIFNNCKPPLDTPIASSRMAPTLSQPYHHVLYSPLSMSAVLAE